MLNFVWLKWTTKRMSINWEQEESRIQRYFAKNEAFAKLLIYHDVITPAAITELLELAPTETCIQGERRMVIGRELPPIPANGWFLSSQKVVSYQYLNEHVDWLLNQLYGKTPAIRYLQNQSARIYITGTKRIRAPGDGDNLDLSTIQRLAQLRIPFGLQITVIDGKGIPIGMNN